MMVWHRDRRGSRGMNEVHPRGVGEVPGMAGSSLGRHWWYRLGLVLQDARGATTAEYALLLALVVIVLIGTLRGLGAALDGKISDIITSIGNAN